ncbi:HlyD family efflux transporter periplasmic adaptor subunit [Aeoliella mucimassa]|uniref:Peptidase family M50 n=1 Tax=Aeoliella mucimassa TaxID=2527972 RepID=A0A518AI24_9BACT|nr:HlyD family efflux transporter periplasmic adaptor subunit [Aeoliella mucimassa]QDU54365.1 Peptidase family M50 [Aeoliella mucimassa]
MAISSTNDALLTLAARRDVLATAVPVAGRRMWVVKDPITLEHHELGEAEYLLLTALERPASLRDLKQLYERQFAPRTIQPTEIHTYLAQLHRAGLLVASGSGQAAELVERANERRATRWRWAWTELLALRLRGVNPDRLLDALLPAAKVLMSPLALFAYALVVLAALLLMASHASEFLARLPALDSLVAPSNWLWLAVVVAVVKVLHELAHAMVAKRMGAEVHEIGVLLLVFVPTLYCDVSDIWNLSNKWHRMAVSAAGMAIELLLAAIATFVWWNSEPGLVNLLAMNVMLVASVGTLLVNANPLMRYDGYYLLSDLVEAPNLWQRSRDAWHRLAGRWFFEPTSHQSPREPWWMPLYGGLSSAYMMLVLVTIFWTLLVALKPLHLDTLAYGLGLVMLGGVVAGPARQLHQTLDNPLKRRQFRPLASSLVLLSAAVVFAAFWWWPLADRVQCQARVVAASPAPIVATLGGRLEQAAPAGKLVAAGEVVATLTNDQLQVTGEQLAAEVKLAELRVQQLRTLRARDAQAARQLPTAEAALDAAREQLREHQQQTERLTLRAAHAGRVMPPPSVLPDEQSLTLARWSGTPLDRENQGAWIEPGTPVAMVADADTREVALAIDENDVELVTPGQRVRVQLAGVGSTPLWGSIRDIARVSTAATSESTGPSRWGTPTIDARPLYEARVVLDDPRLELPLESGGRAKVETGRTTLGAWVIRELRDAFRLP